MSPEWTLGRLARHPKHHHPGVGEAGGLVGGGPHLGDFELLVSEETFHRVQAITEGRMQVTGPRQRTRPDFPLKGLVRCEACGRPLTASWSEGRNGHYAGSCRSSENGNLFVPGDDVPRNNAQFSPDGRWIGYAAGAFGRLEVSQWLGDRPPTQSAFLDFATAGQTSPTSGSPRRSPLAIGWAKSGVPDPPELEPDS